MHWINSTWNYIWDFGVILVKNTWDCFDFGAKFKKVQKWEAEREMRMQKEKQQSSPAAHFWNPELNFVFWLPFSKENNSSTSTMDLDAKIQANAQGFFVVTFFNKQEESLTEPNVKYIFSKFGQVSEIKFVEHGQVFISYKKKEEALKAFEIMNMGKKYHVEITVNQSRKMKLQKASRLRKKILSFTFTFPQIPGIPWKLQWKVMSVANYLVLEKVGTLSILFFLGSIKNIWKFFLVQRWSKMK